MAFEVSRTMLSRCKDPIQHKLVLRSEIGTFRCHNENGGEFGGEARACIASASFHAIEECLLSCTEVIHCFSLSVGLKAQLSTRSILHVHKPAADSRGPSFGLFKPRDPSSEMLGSRVVACM